VIVQAALDHLVIAAATLEQGEDYIESRIGVRPQRGGQHVAMGTHNSVLTAGPDVYLEVIAIDPEGIAPKRARWFELDRPAMQATLRASPRLIHWVARCADIDAARRACSVDPGAVHLMSRGELNWKITIPDDGRLSGAGVLPTLIEWEGARHPADAMHDAGVRLIALAAAHPEPAAMRTALVALGLGDVLQVTFAAAPRLAAMLRTPRGPVTL
jgi:hypothetical protein